MCRTIGMKAQLLFFALCTPGVFAQGLLGGKLSLSATLGTGDVYRGLQRTNRDVIAHARAKLQFERFSVGVAVHDAQFSSAFSGPSNDHEVDYYLAYSWEVNEDFRWQLQFNSYTFPGSNDNFIDYDSNELALSFELPAGLSWSLSVSDTELSFAEGIAYSEVSWRRALPMNYEVSIGLGGVKSLSADYNGYGYWDAGLSRAFNSVAIDIRYHSTGYERNWRGSVPAGNQWVLSLTKGWTF